MREVVIAGVGMVPFGSYPDRTHAQLAAPAVLDALRDAGADRASVEAVYAGNVTGGMLVGQRVLRDLGLLGPPVVNVENACSSSAAALREAFVAVASGLHDTVLVLGVEKLSAVGPGALALDMEDFEVANGLVMPAVYAMRASRYLYDFAAEPADLAAVAVKARRHGTLNPHARFRTETTVEEVLSSRMIASPLTLYQCSPKADGAAAILVTAAERADRFAAPAVRIRSSVLRSGRFQTGFRDMTTPEITVRCAAESYEDAHIGPEDLDVAEIHDAFTIAELLYYEALGLCDRGEAVGLLNSGATTFGGATVVNPSGGLLAKGHPIGATGAAQVVELVWQLRGRAGDRQVEGARIGMSHATGGGLSGVDHGACAIHILEGPART